MIQEVEKPDPALVGQVRAYLEQAPEHAGVCAEHDPSWLEVLRQGLGHRPIMLIARPDTQGPDPDHPPQHQSSTSRICGYLPLAVVASRLFGRFLVSLPYLNRAGVVAEDTQTQQALVEHALALSDRLNVQYLELRHHGHVSDHQAFNAKRDDKMLMVLDLPDSGEGLWKAINAKVRNQVRKGDKSELSLRWGGLDVLDDFYQVFSVNMRDLGTPVYPKKLFASILKHLAGRSELAVVDCQGQPIAGALLVHDHGWTQVPSASCLRAFNRTNANMWMYHKLLARTIERGNGQFDFGRSSVDSGTYRFKKQWGAKPQPTVWQYHVRRGDVTRMRPDSPKNRRRVEMWQKLPVWLTRMVGPTIVRGIP